MDKCSHRFAPAECDNTLSPSGFLCLRAFFLALTLFLWAPSSSAIQNCIDATGGSFVVNWPTVEITAELFMNGAPFSTQPANSVQIWLSQDGVLQRKIADSHLAPTAQRVVAGTYDLVYRNLTQTDPTLPRNPEGTFQTGLVIDTDGTLVVDIPRVELAGDITLENQPFPTTLLAHAHLFAIQNGGDEEVFLGDTVDGSNQETPFGAVLLPGEYNIVYRNITGGTTIPANRNALIAIKDLFEDDLNYSLNVSNHDLSGNFLLNGAPAPISVLENGEIELRRLRNGIVDFLPLGMTIDQTYARKHLGGLYDVHYFAVQSHGLIPRNPHAVISTGHFLTAGVFDVDVPSTRYRGDFLVNAQPAPVSPIETGKIYFLDRLTGAEIIVGDTMDQSYDNLAMVPGAYDILYRHTIGSVFVPRNDEGIVARDVTFGASPLIILTVDVDIPMTDTAINLTQNGVSIPMFAGNGDVLLLNDDRSFSLDLGNSAALPWNGQLISGQYFLEWSHANGAGVPRNSDAVLQGRVSMGASDEMVFDMPTLSVSPAGQVNGAPFPPGNTAFMYLFDGPNAAYFADANGTWPTREILQGRYNVLYIYQAGGVIAQNQLHSQFCIHAEFCILCDGFE